MRPPTPLLLLFYLCACGAGSPMTGHCASSSDCVVGASCVDGMCVSPRDAGLVDLGAPDAGCACAAGEVCQSGACSADCGNPDAMACGASMVCDYATGHCAAIGAAGILTGAATTCSGTGAHCLPGSECGLDGTCIAAPPCSLVRCNADHSTCWGASCVATRPAGACAPASLARMNMADFLAGGDGGDIDLEFDDACNAYAVTIISGTDYLRQLAPDGTLTVWNGVTNLNMGEVAALRRPGGEFGTSTEGEVALTYTCCATCGCISSDPQGVAHLDRTGTSSLPMVIIAMPSTGAGPFGSTGVDTGPYGLTWGRDRNLYVGNVTTQGDLVRADLDLGTTMEIHRLPARIHAMTNFDPSSLLAALAGGAIERVSISTSATAPWGDVGEDVTSLVRDPFTGRVYVSLHSGRIVELNADGTMHGDLTPAPTHPGRLAYAADGYLYFLNPPFLGGGAITRYALPATL